MQKQANEINVEEYFVQQENENNDYVKNVGYADSVKQSGATRLFHTNSNGFGPDNFEKTQMVLQSQKRMCFDRMFLSSLDCS